MRIVEANNRALGAYGYTRDELLQLTVRDLRSPEAKVALDGQMKHVKEQNGAVFETVHQRKDGTTFPVEVSSRVIEVEGKEFYQSIIRDISERKQSEQALEDSERKYKSLVDNALAGIYRTNLRGEILYVNETAVRMMGFKSAEEVKSFGVLHRYKNPQDREKIIAALRRTGWVQDFEVELLTKSGETRSALVSATLEGDVVSGMVLDITGRKRVKEALKLFRTLVDQSNDAIEVLDPETGRFLDMNERGCQDLGYTREEALSLSVFDIDPMVDQSTFTRAMEELRKSGVLLREGIHRRKDGSTFPVEVNLRYVQLDRDYIVTDCGGSKSNPSILTQSLH